MQLDLVARAEHLREVAMSLEVIEEPADPGSDLRLTGGVVALGEADPELTPVAAASAKHPLVKHLGEDQLHDLSERPVRCHRLVPVEVVVASKDRLAQVVRHRDSGDPSVRDVQVLERLARAREVDELLEVVLHRSPDLVHVRHIATVGPKPEVACIDRIEEILEERHARTWVVRLGPCLADHDDASGMFWRVRTARVEDDESAVFRRLAPLRSTVIGTSRAMLSSGNRYSLASTKIIRWMISSRSVRFRVSPVRRSTMELSADVLSAASSSVSAAALSMSLTPRSLGFLRIEQTTSMPPAIDAVPE